MITIAAIEAGLPTLVDARQSIDRFHDMIRRKLKVDLLKRWNLAADDTDNAQTRLVLPFRATASASQLCRVIFEFTKRALSQLSKGFIFRAGKPPAPVCNSLLNTNELGVTSGNVDLHELARCIRRAALCHVYKALTC